MRAIAFDAFDALLYFAIVTAGFIGFAGGWLFGFTSSLFSSRRRKES